MQEKQLSFGEELSEEQLESVAGGGKNDQSGSWGVNIQESYNSQK